MSKTTKALHRRVLVPAPTSPVDTLQVLVGLDAFVMLDALSPPLMDSVDADSTLVVYEFLSGALEDSAPDPLDPDLFAHLNRVRELCVIRHLSRSNAKMVRSVVWDGERWHDCGVGKLGYSERVKLVTRCECWGGDVVATLEGGAWKIGDAR
jgi:hypothetical protein